MQSSLVTFRCKLGHFLFSKNQTLTTECRQDGTWNPVNDCKPHPCWENLPSRPINAAREVGLVLNIANGDTHGSHVNMTCNPMYEVVGRSRLYCINNIWEKNDTKCLPIQKVCLRNPPHVLEKENARLVSLKRLEFKREIRAHEYQSANHYASATYVCLSGGFRFTKTCIGQDEWDDPPACAQNIKTFFSV